MRRSRADSGICSRRLLQPSLGRYPATGTISGLTAAVGGAQFIWPSLLDRLRRDRARLQDGEWWRLVTSILVQSDGVGQYAYNLTGSVLVGVAVESRCGHARWLACYLAGGLAANVAAYQPVGDYGLSRARRVDDADAMVVDRSADPSACFAVRRAQVSRARRNGRSSAARRTNAVARTRRRRSGRASSYSTFV